VPVLPGLTFDDAIGFSDAELERRLDGLVHKVDAHDGNLADDLWLLIGELTERHAPHIARMSLERIFAGEGWAEDLEENLEAMREHEGARLIRSALEGD
jgi:hypothetical protein